MHTWISLTTTPQATYTDAGGGTPNDNPVSLDAGGFADIWLTVGESYTIAVHNSSDVLQWSVDSVTSGTLDTNLVVGTTAVTFTSTPTFNSATSVYFSITLTGNVTSSTISNATDGRVVYFNICQDATGDRTFIWDALVLTAPTVGSGVSVCTSASFIYDGTNWRELAPSSRGSAVFDTSTIGVLNNTHVIDGVKYPCSAAGVNAAITDSPATGGTVDVEGCQGAQTISATIVVNKPIHLKFGAGTYSGSVDPLVSVTSSDVTVSGLGGDATELSNTTLTASVIRVADGLSNVTIRDLHLDGAGKTIDQANRDQGVLLWVGDQSGSATSNIVVERNLFTDGHLGILFQLVNDSRIVNNRLVFTHDAWIGFNLWSSDSNVIAHNTLTDTGGTATGIEIVHAANNPSLLNTVSSNTLTGFDAEAINLSGIYNTAANNTISTTNGTGIQVLQGLGGDTSNQTHHNSVIGNTIDSAASTNRGIGIKDDDTENAGANDNLILGNIVRMTGTAFGIVINDFCLRNTVQGNLVNAGSGATSDGIVVSGSSADFNRIIANRVTGAGRYGIYSNSADDTTISLNEVFSNGDDGIRIDGGSNPTITNNYVYLNADFGIVLGGNPTNVTYHGNKVRDNTDTDEVLGAATFLTNTTSFFGATPVANLLEGQLSNQPRWLLKIFEHTDIVDAATAGDFVLWTLPVNTMIHDVVGELVTEWAGSGPVSAAVCSVGTAGGSANDLALDDDFFTTAQTIYELHDGTASGGKGALLFDGTDKFAPYMFVAGGNIEIQCDLTGGDHADTSAGQARIQIFVSQPLANTTTEAN